MFRHILLPVEDSDISRRATSVALALAKACQSSLLTLHVVLPERADSCIPRCGTTAAQNDDMALAERCLSLVQDAAEQAGVPCDCCIMQGAEPWDVIAQVASDKHCDLIVMGTHGKRGLSRLIVGSETHSVLLHGDIPVLTCP